MLKGEYLKYFLGAVGILVLIVLVITLTVKGFKGNQPDYAAPLTDYANATTQVSLTVDGPVVADQNHSAYRITVDRVNVTVEALQGYGERVIDTKTYSNNQASFYSFLRALDFAGFNKGKQATTENANDERGVCAAGDRYIFSIVDSGTTLQRYWTSSCGGGTFKGSRIQVKQLFTLQVPDFDSVVGSLNL